MSSSDVNISATHRNKRTDPEASECRRCLHSTREEFRCSSFGLSHPNPYLLASAQWGWQNVYTGWRVLWVVYHVAWLTYDVVVDTMENEYPGTWLAFLTNWSFLILVSSVIIRAVVVLYVKCAGKDFRDGQTPWYLQVSWMVYEVASVTALLISFVFFVLLFDGELSLRGGIKHVGNSAFVLLDLWVTAMPVRLLHVVYPLGLGLLYGAFSAVYWAAGGTNDQGEPYVYAVLDWSKPKTAALALTVVVLGGAPGSHLLLWLLHLARVAVYRGCCRRDGEGQREESHEMTSAVP